ncbi:MAG TPA: Npt1/Npt2 family nucleotide transporter, partial [Candidatus Angelobacter sp.]|nr:Npt1/Npt2 family nucleotide transporter [Candidatus Angelobacter sp.]
WVGIFGVLAPTQIWTLANYLLTTREAKRVFGMVGGGGILGWIFGGYVSRVVTKAYGTESLLLAMAALLAICSAVMASASTGGRLRVDSAEPPTAGISGAGQKDLRGGIRSVVGSPYLRAIAAVICISSFVTTITGWQFKALAQDFSNGKDAMAIFFGDFYFYAGVLSLLFQLLLTTRLLRRFGIGRILFVLPVVVLAGSVGLLVWGTIAAALFLKGGDQVLRHSVDRSTTELLYLPLPNRVKVEAKWFIDTVVWRLGDGLAGVLVLLFAAQLGWTPQQISWIVILLIFGWLAAVRIVGKQYVVVLQDSISQHRLDAESASTLALDRATSDLLESRIRTSVPEDILYALGLFEVERQRKAHPVVRGLLHHASPAVRQKAVSILSAVGDKSVRPTIEGLLLDPDAGVRTEAMLYLVYQAQVDPLTLLTEIGGCDDFSVRSGIAVYLARPGEAQNIETARQILVGMSRESGEVGERTRLELARILGELTDSFDPLLATLLHDPAQPVVRQAIRSVGALQKPSLAANLLELLPNPELSSEVAEALAKFGDQVVILLSGKLGDSRCCMETRRAIPPILVSIGTPAAAGALCDNLLERDTTLRFHMISALNKIHQLHPEIVLDMQLVETVLAAEITGHYRSYQIQEALGLTGTADEPVMHALQDSIQQELERIFRLLGLLYPRLDLHSAYFGLQSKDSRVHDNALEFLETILKAQLRAVLLPLLDGKVSPGEKARMAEHWVRARVESREQAVAELTASDDPWLKSCGAYAIGKFGINSLEAELALCLEHPDPLLRETARTARIRLDTLAPHN